MNDGHDCQHEIDARGLLCPEPVMLLHARVRRLAPGEVFRLVATDPSTTRDVPKFCEHLGHTLLSSLQQADEYVYVIRKRS